MMPFLTGACWSRWAGACWSRWAGLERVGVAGPELELPLGRSAGSGRWTPLQKQETKGDRPGLARRRSDA